MYTIVKMITVNGLTVVDTGFDFTPSKLQTCQDFLWDLFRDRPANTSVVNTAGTVVFNLNDRIVTFAIMMV